MYSKLIVFFKCLCVLCFLFVIGYCQVISDDRCPPGTEYVNNVCTDEKIFERARARKSGPGHGKIVACYFSGTTRSSFTTSNIDPQLCTNVVYGIELHQLYEDQNAFLNLKLFKRMYPHLNVTISFSNVEYTFARTYTLADILQLIENYNFNGIDLYLSTNVSDTLESLVKKLRYEFHDRQYIFTATLGLGWEKNAKKLLELTGYFDFIHFFPIAIRSKGSLIGGNARYDLNQTVSMLTDKNKNAEVLVLILPFYGQAYDIQPLNVLRLWSKRSCTGVEKQMPYNEICLLPSSTASAWTALWDGQHMSPYLRKGQCVVIYDNTRSIANKAKSVADYNLGGVMAMTVDMDDFGGQCEVENDTYQDYENRFYNLLEDPVFKEAVTSFKVLGKQIKCYVNNNEKQDFCSSDLWNSNINYPLLWAINQALMVALEEKEIILKYHTIMAKKNKSKENRTKVDQNVSNDEDDEDVKENKPIGNEQGKNHDIVTTIKEEEKVATNYTQHENKTNASNPNEKVLWNKEENDKKKVINEHEERDKSYGAIYLFCILFTVLMICIIYKLRDILCQRLGWR